MSSVSSMFSGFVVMIVCCIIGLVCAFGIGLANDNILSGLDDAGVYEDTPDEWQGVYDQTTAPTIDLMYFCIFLIPLSGLVIFGLTVFKDQWRRRL